MTHPTQPGPPGRAAVGPVLEVVVDRRRVNRMWLPQLVVNGVFAALLAAVVVGMLVVGPTEVRVAVAPFLVLLVWQVVMTSWVAQQRHDLLRPGPVLVLDRTGVALRGRQGTIRAPWHAVSAVTTESRLTGERLRVRLVPPSSWPAYGVTLDHVDGRTRRVMGRLGLQYSWRILAFDRDLLLRAFADLSGGRVLPTAR